MPRPAADRSPTALHTRARLPGGGPQGCNAQRHQWRLRSEDQGGGGGTGGRRPWEDSGRALRPERPGPGDQPKGDAPRAVEMQPPPRGSRDRCRKPWVTPGPARAPMAKPPFPRRGCDSAVRGPEGRGLRGVRLCTAQGPVGNGSGVALIRLMRPDGSRSPQHCFCVFSFLFWLV